MYHRRSHGESLIIALIRQVMIRCTTRTIMTMIDTCPNVNINLIDSHFSPMSI
jgi:hypothetical protein